MFLFPFAPLASHVHSCFLLHLLSHVHSRHCWPSKLILHTHWCFLSNGLSLHTHAAFLSIPFTYMRRICTFTGLGMHPEIQDFYTCTASFHTYSFTQITTAILSLSFCLTQDFLTPITHRSFISTHSYSLPWLCIFCPFSINPLLPKFLPQLPIRFLLSMFILMLHSYWEELLMQMVLLSAVLASPLSTCKGTGGSSCSLSAPLSFAEYASCSRGRA